MSQNNKLLITRFMAIVLGTLFLFSAFDKIINFNIFFESLIKFNFNPYFITGLGLFLVPSIQLTLAFILIYHSLFNFKENYTLLYTASLFMTIFIILSIAISSTVIIMTGHGCHACHATEKTGLYAWLSLSKCVFALFWSGAINYLLFKNKE